MAPNNRQQTAGVKMDRPTIISVVIAGSALAFFAFAPESRINAASSSVKRMFGHNGQICLDAWAENLRDPKSAVLVGSEARDGRMYITYRAQNGFGTYVQNRESCKLDAHGNVDPTFAKIEVTAIYMERLASP
jgi:hypothetical protein